MQGMFGWSGWAATQEDILRVAQNMSAATGGASPERPQLATYRDACVGAVGRGRAYVYEGNGMLVAVYGRPGWNDPHLQRRAKDVGIVQSICEAYRSGGIDIIHRLTGPFAIALTGREETLLAADRMGITPLFYTLQKGCLTFGSTLDALAAHPSVSRDLDPQQLFNYSYFHMVPGPGTVFRGHQRVLPGQYVRYKSGVITPGNYWTPTFQEHERLPLQQLKREFRDILRRSVKHAAEGATAGTFLSGGTDSSTITGLLSESSDGPVRTYSIGFDAEGYDEMEYARIAAKHFGTDHHEYYVTPADVVDAIPLIADAYEQPYGNSSAIPTYYCSRLAKADGVDVLLGGDGGDELFGGNTRYAKQHVFQSYYKLPLVLRKYVIQPAVLSLPQGFALAPLRKLRSYVTQAVIPMPQRMESYNLVNRFGIETMFTPDFMETVDPANPLSLVEETYQHAQADSLINKMLAVDFRFTLADNDLPKVVRMTQVAGIEARFPMLDEALIAFSLRLDPRLKLKGTKLRYFFKEALRDFLPQEIITKTKHGFGLPFGPWLRTHKPLQDLVYDSLSRLRRRHIYRADFIDRLNDTYLHSHPGYYGTMVWVMMMLELWHQTHVDHPDRRPQRFGEYAGTSS